MYAIVKTPNFYAGTLGAPQEQFVKNGDIGCELNASWLEAFDISLFDTEEKAQEIIETILEGGGPYYLAHGEAGQPDYTIVDFEAGDGKPDCYPGTDLDCESWEGVVAGDLPDVIKDKLDQQNVEWSSSHDDYDIFDAMVDGNEEDADQCDGDGDPYRYRIVFCPRSLAIERCGGDLGALNWDNAGYYRSK